MERKTLKPHIYRHYYKTLGRYLWRVTPYPEPGQGKPGPSVRMWVAANTFADRLNQKERLQHGLS